MAKKQVPVVGGLRKVINIPDASQNTATTIAGLSGQTVSIAQLRALLGLSSGQAPNTVGAGSAGTLVIGPGLNGGGPLVGAIPLNLTNRPQIFWDDALLPDDAISGSGITPTGVVPGSYTSTNLTVNAFGQITAAANGAGGGGAVTQIAQQVLSSASATVTFSAIPGSYSGLVLSLLLASATSAPTFQLQFNGDTAAHYSCQILYGSAPTSGANNNNVSSGTSMAGTIMSAGASPLAALARLYIPYYAATTLDKVVTGTWSRFDSATAYFQGAWGGLWTSTAAITSITFSLSSGTFAAGSAFTLYGET